jgi:hypothetical protein
LKTTRDRAWNKEVTGLKTNSLLQMLAFYNFPDYTL